MWLRAGQSSKRCHEDITMTRANRLIGLTPILESQLLNKKNARSTVLEYRPAKERAPVAEAFRSRQ